MLHIRSKSTQLVEKYADRFRRCFLGEIVLVVFNSTKKILDLVGLKTVEKGRQAALVGKQPKRLFDLGCRHVAVAESTLEIELERVCNGNPAMLGPQCMVAVVIGSATNMMCCSREQISNQISNNIAMLARGLDESVQLHRRLVVARRIHRITASEHMLKGCETGVNMGQKHTNRFKC